MPRRVDTAFELVKKQRKLVETTRIGSPAHRQASDVLALIEESHFLLSELERTSIPPRIMTQIKSTLPRPEALVPAARERRRFTLELALAFAAALVAAAFFLEMADPAPMNIQASELGTTPTAP